jgi:hypothetical protein
MVDENWHWCSMDREQLERRLAIAEKNVALGYEVIAEQRLAVAGLAAWSFDPWTACRMLASFEMLQERLLDDLETARIQLAAYDERKRRAAS